MEFISYPIPIGVARPPSTEILKTRRIELHLTQQQVADGAGILLQQYQRIETGERNIESASMKTALAICAVLKIDPFIFFPDCVFRNKYSYIAKRKDEYAMKEEAIPVLLEHACSLCNEHMHTNYSMSNIMVVYCTSENCLEIRKEFISKYDFASAAPAKDDAFLVEAFIGQTDIDDPSHVDGILIRTDPPEDLDNPESYLTILVHELSHIFCVTHETEVSGKAGQRFYDLYCAGTPDTAPETVSQGQINTGYMIWREFIAEIIQDIVYQQPSKHLRSISPVLKLLAAQVKLGNSSAKSAFHRYLSEIMNSWEGSEAETWEDLEPQLIELDLPFIRIVKHVFDNLHGKDCYTITPKFIEELGGMYIADMIKNSPEEELMKFASSFGYKFM